jgi:hypothetical protein
MQNQLSPLSKIQNVVLILILYYDGTIRKILLYINIYNFICKEYLADVCMLASMRTQADAFFCCMQEWVRACISGCMHLCICAYVHMCMLATMRVHACIQAYVHVCLHAHAPSLAHRAGGMRVAVTHVPGIPACEQACVLTSMPA